MTFTGSEEFNDEDIEREANEAIFFPVGEKIFITRFPRDDFDARDVSSYLQRSHNKHYKIINCMSEQEREDLFCDELLTPELGFLDAPGCVENYPLTPNTPGAVKQLLRFCISEDTYLSRNQSNVLCIMCKTGKGRSCMMAACMLLHLGACMSAADAIAKVCDARSATAINFPSQIRYVHYYERLLRSPAGEYSQTLRINSVRITTIPCFDASILNPGCTPHVTVSLLAQIAELTVLESTAPFRNHVVFDQQQRWTEEKKKGTFYSKAEYKTIDLDLTGYTILVRGDTVMCLFSHAHKMLQVSFHTAFIADNYLRFDRSTCDLAHLDMHHVLFDKGLTVELFFSRVADVPELNIGDFIGRPREEEALILIREEDSVN